MNAVIIILKLLFLNVSDVGPAVSSDGVEGFRGDGANSNKVNAPGVFDEAWKDDLRGQVDGNLEGF